MKPENPEVDSALHVLKGAIQKILDATLTTSVYAKGEKGRITVEFDRKPTEGEIEKIEQLANKKIKEDLPIKMFEMDREKAEEKYGNIIYDKFPVPEHVKKLTITQIPNWNINCCLGPHLDTTGEIGKIKITNVRPRTNRKELEVSFKVQKQQ